MSRSGYRVPRERITTFKEYAIRALQRRVSHDEFWALKGVNLEVNPTEVFGIVGRQRGRQEHPLAGRGRASSSRRAWPGLGEGAGRAAAGAWGRLPHGADRPRERPPERRAARVRQARDPGAIRRILDFAGIDDFIDAPLRTYSTGMVARLGFSVATAIRPGDLDRGRGALGGRHTVPGEVPGPDRRVPRAGTCILLVAHSLPTIRDMCDRAIWLAHGEVQAFGDAQSVARKYEESF